MNLFKTCLKASLSLLMIFGIVGCSTNSRFHTQPEGAKLYINGDYIGETPINFPDRRSLPTRLHLQIRKEGYKELNMYLDKSGDYLGQVAMAVPYFFGLGVFIFGSLDTEYHFNLSSLQLEASAKKE